MTDWKPTMLTASAPSGEMMTWINPSAIEQLQREVDALKVQAAPTPVEDEVTEAMVEAGKDAWGRAVNRYLDDTDCWVAVYSAMRAAAAPTSEPSAELVALRARCERLARAMRIVRAIWTRNAFRYAFTRLVDDDTCHALHEAVADLVDGDLVALDAAEEAK